MPKRRTLLTAPLAVLAVLAVLALACQPASDLPTHTPYPTYTPYPTLTTGSKWTAPPVYGGQHEITVLNTDETGDYMAGPWVLRLGCGKTHTPVVLLSSITRGVFSEEARPLDITAYMDGDGAISSQVWSYYPRDWSGEGYIILFTPDQLIRQLLTSESESVTFSIPALDGEYKVTFNVVGLGDYLSDPADLCNGSEANANQ